MENKYIISIIVAGAIPVITTCYAINKVNSSFNEANQNLNGLYNCFAVDLPEVRKGLRELNWQFQKIDTHAAKIEGDLEKIGKRINECNEEFNEKLIQALERLDSF